MRKGLIFLTAVLIFAAAGCASKSSAPAYSAGPVDFTLQLLHFADIDGNEERALSSVDEFSALVNAFKNDATYGNSTLVVSSGDNIIPGPRFYAAEQKPVRAVTGSNEPGHADIAFLNYLGVKASAMGNHDLDAGPGELVDAMSSESKDGVTFPGATFPYLSANLDFSTDRDASEIMGTNGENVDNLQGKMAAYAVVTVNGETIGLVGASTPTLNVITTSGGIGVTPDADTWTIDQLAAAIQPSIDALTASGVNKIILLSHMQQISIEKELASKLKDVDVIVAGGSNTRMGDMNDTLYEGDDAFDEHYPYTSYDDEGKPVLVVNVDGDYKYVGRLVVGFDADGVVVTNSLDEEVNGSWATTEANVAALGGTASPEIVAVRDAVQGVITTQYGNVLGYTNVYLDGRRSQVRTQETNLGNLSADANLWYANLLSEETVDVSIKNGGGIRTEIGSAIVPPGSVDYSQAVLSAPAANSEAGTEEGAVTEGHLRATLRFDNGLVVAKVTAEELKMLLEHSVSDSAPGATPGKFPQLAGMTMTFDMTAAPGNRITSLEVLNSDGSVKDTVVADGAVAGDAARTFRVVTLNYLYNGGDNYPFDQLSDSQRVNLYEGLAYGEDTDYPDAVVANDPGRNSSFSYTGGEQDAFAEYLMAVHGDKNSAYNSAETPQSEDMRIKY